MYEHGQAKKVEDVFIKIKMAGEHFEQVGLLEEFVDQFSPSDRTEEMDQQLTSGGSFKLSVANSKRNLGL